jgi:tubulin--tyrosine ligase
VAVNYGKEDSRLGSVYSALTKYLLQRRGGDWHRKPRASGLYHLILGEASGGGIDWGKLAACSSMYGSRPLSNYYRGFRTLCRKTMMVEMLRDFGDAVTLGDGSGAVTTEYTVPSRLAVDSYLPSTFLFFPAKRENSERDEFTAEYARRAEAGLDNTWILKPSDGAKGESIVVMDDRDAILAFLDAKDAGSIAWVVQKYLENPMLLPGGRKFDVRCWVLVTHTYDIYIYTQGVLRTSSVAFSLSDLDDRFAHLCNHCVQELHPDYGSHNGEPTNELFYTAFDSYLEASGLTDCEGRPVRLASHILPQIEAQVIHSLLAARGNMEVGAVNDYQCFNLFGYDFMLDDTGKVLLVEVNSSPAVAARLLDGLIDDLVNVAIDPLFPPQAREGVVPPLAQPRRLDDEVEDDVKFSGSPGRFKQIFAAC